VLSILQHQALKPSAVKPGSTWGQPGIDLGQNGVNPGSTRDQTGSTWGQPGVKFGSTQGQTGVNCSALPRVRDVPRVARHREGETLSRHDRDIGARWVAAGVIDHGEVTAVALA